jgi:two-component system LytT family response regulator
MIRVLIADDEQLARERIANLLSGEAGIEIAGECRNGPETVEMINSLRPDLVFLDIQMPGYDGLEVLEKISSGPVPEIVFVTAYDQYTLQAFAAHAIDYLLKPFDNERFREMLRYARKRLSSSQSGSGLDPELKRLLAEMRAGSSSQWLERIPLRQSQSIRFLDVAQLVCCEAEGSYVRLFTADQNFLIRENLGNLERKLDPSKFTRIHRSSLVRVEAIRELQSWSDHEWLAVLSNGRKYVVSRARREKLKKIMGI